MELSPAWLENMIERAAREDRVARVLSVSSSPAVGKGDNYASQLLRLKMRVVLGSGTVATRSLLVKTLHTEGPIRDFLIAYNSFPTEIVTFSGILSEFEKLMLERGDTREKLWSDCIWWRPHDLLVFQDLKDLGYRNMSRMERMDMEHAVLTLNSLGRLHGMSVVLLQEGRIEESRIKPYPMARNEAPMNQLLITGLETMAKIMKESWGSEWALAAENLALLSVDIGPRIHQLCNEKSNKLVVLNHGDCWINNIMFKYASWTDSPIGLRFVDFQDSHFNTFGWDLTYFLRMSVSPRDVQTNSERLLGAYRDSLVETLEFYGCRPDNVPSLEDIKDELDRLLVYGLAISLSFLPPTLAEAEALAAADDFFTDSATDEHKTALCRGPKFTEIAKMTINYCIKRGVL